MSIGPDKKCRRKSIKTESNVEPEVNKNTFFQDILLINKDNSLFCDKKKSYLDKYLISLIKYS